MAIKEYNSRFCGYYTIAPQNIVYMILIFTKFFQVPDPFRKGPGSPKHRRLPVVKGEHRIVPPLDTPDPCKAKQRRQWKGFSLVI